MSLSTLLILIIVGFFIAYFLGGQLSKQKAKPLGGIKSLASLPSYYATMVALWAAIPAVIVLFTLLIFEDSIIRFIVIQYFPDASSLTKPENNAQLIYNQIQNIAAGTDSQNALPSVYQVALNKYRSLTSLLGQLLPILTLSTLVVGMLIGLRAVKAKKNARKSVEKVFNKFILICSLIAIFTTLGIVFSVFFESMLFFEKVPFSEFLFGTHWSPQIAIRADQAGASGAFGVIPLIIGTLLISFIALLVAVPVGLMSAIYLAEYANKRTRNILKPLLEILAGIPTVVYGFFAALTVAPLLRNSFENMAGWLYGIGQDIQNWSIDNNIAGLKNINLLSMFESLGISSESALAAGFVMGIMIIPFVSSLSDDVITAVPRSLRDGSLGLGATHSETIKKVVFPAAIPGIIGGILLAASRAIGETMIVVMAAGLAANLTINPLEAVTTVTVQIVTLLVGDQEFDSAKTLAAFALGLFLFVITLFLNIIALKVVQKYREQYD